MEYREIKFRGKRQCDGKWIYGYYIVAAGMPFIKSFATEPILIIPETVGQYIGTNNYENKEIYEGDILETSLVVVEWNAEKCGFVVRSLITHDIYEIHNSILMCEIIGNIHDNAELLEEKEMKTKEKLKNKIEDDQVEDDQVEDIVEDVCEDIDDDYLFE